MRSFVRLASALVALGLFASLGPPVTYVASTSGTLSGDILIAWPGSGVQQALGPLNGQVGQFYIWVSAAPGTEDVTVRASLVDAATNETVRQTAIEAVPAVAPTRRPLRFPEYVVQEGQQLSLLLHSLPSAPAYVAYALVDPQPGLASPSMNTVPDQGSGPLAFSRMRTSRGLPAAIAGEPSGRVRLALAAVFGAFALLLSPRVATPLKAAGSAGRRTILQTTARVRRFGGSRAGESTSARGPLGVPWYPWLIAAAPIIHFLASNQLVFAATEAVGPLLVTLILVTASVVGLRLFLKDWHRPAAVTAALTAVTFGYGHVETAFDPPIDERVLFPVAVVALAAAVSAALRAARSPGRGTQFLNVAAAVLLIMPLISLAIGWAEPSERASSASEAQYDDLWAHVFPSGLPTPTDQRPDIYYLVFDEYPRHDVFEGFDNAEFRRALESRGFYIASRATSNFKTTTLSLASTLNLAYIQDVVRKDSNLMGDAFDRGRHHAIGALLKHLGYAYIHLDSGIKPTDISPLADTVATFTPQGIRATGEDMGGGIQTELSQCFPGILFASWCEQPP